MYCVIHWYLFLLALLRLCCIVSASDDAVNMDDGSGGYDPDGRRYVWSPDATNEAYYPYIGGFGISVSVTSDDSFAVVGAEAAHSVYLFEKQDTGPYTDEWNVSASHVYTYEGVAGFGVSVAAHDDRIVVGASDANRVYMYLRDAPGRWPSFPTSILYILDGEFLRTQGNFGVSVALSDWYVLVGANKDMKAYIFYPDDDGAWSSQSHINVVVLEAPETVRDFGISVALCDTFAVVASNLERKVYIFERAGERTRANNHGWDPDVHAVIDAFSDVNFFGSAVAISPDGDDLIVGADGNNTAYIFQHLGQDLGWALKHPTVLDGYKDKSLFGMSVGLRGDSAIVSAVGAQAAYIFRKFPDPNHPAQYMWNTTALAIEGYQDQFGFGRSCDMGSTSAVVATTGNLRDKLFTFRRPESPFPNFILPDDDDDESARSGSSSNNGGDVEAGVVAGATAGVVLFVMAAYVWHTGWRPDMALLQARLKKMMSGRRSPHSGHRLGDQGGWRLDKGGSKGKHDRSYIGANEDVVELVDRGEELSSAIAEDRKSTAEDRKSTGTPRGEFGPTTAFSVNGLFESILGPTTSLVSGGASGGETRDESGAGGGGGGRDGVLDGLMAGMVVHADNADADDDDMDDLYM